MSVSNELKLSANAVQILRARYLRKDSTGKIIEKPAELFDRVAGVVAGAERAFGASSQQVDAIKKVFFSMMSQCVFLPNSPTLMNAGRELGMLSACFVLPVEDSIDGIFEAVKHTAQIQKAGGGTGFALDRLRPSGDYIASSGGTTSGFMSFWRVFSEATHAIQQGAFRRGANMAMCSIEHPDILKFITAKSNSGAFENFNISVKVGDAFMSDLRADGGKLHTVRNPRTNRQYYLPVGLDIDTYGIAELVSIEDSPASPCYTLRDIWELVIQGAWATGEPGVCFIDRVNAANPTPAAGRIEATNPCGEQPLLDYEACNLGSIDVSMFIHDGRLDEPALRETIRHAVQFLDDVIEINNYIIPEIDRQCRANRKVGLGIMGFADALFKAGIRYDSDDALAFGRQVASVLREEAHSASEQLAGDRGSFPDWAGSVWDKKYHRPMRNAAVTTIAPTGTLSILAGCSGGIEPVYSLVFVRRVLDGREMVEVNGPFRQYAERAGFWSDELPQRLARGDRLADIDGVDERAREIFVSAHDVAPQWHVRMQAVFQEFIDGAISKTINLPNSAGPSDVDGVYQLAYDLNCKGVTVYRDGCRQGQPMTHTAQTNCPRCRGPLGEPARCTRCPHCGSTLCS